jgi:hypothetical protein
MGVCGHVHVRVHVRVSVCVPWPPSSACACICASVCPPTRLHAPGAETGDGVPPLRICEWVGLSVCVCPHCTPSPGFMRFVLKLEKGHYLY